MHVLLTGADGFIGSALVEALEAEGHALTLVVRDADAARRRWQGHRIATVDFARAGAPDDWVVHLRAVDAVVNTVGIFQERGGNTFEAVHVRGPVALFRACAGMGVPRVVQVSALGADENATSAFHRSKRRADLALLALPLRATVLRPSLVFAPGGTSARLFLRLAALPLIPLPGGGRQCVQPVHRDDVVRAIVNLLAMADPPRLIDCVGPHPLTLRDYLLALRRGLGLRGGRFVTVPRFATQAAAAVGSAGGGGLMDRDAMAMLERGNCADAAAFASVLGRAPRPVEHFIPRERRSGLRQWAQLSWLLPLLRVSLALVWIVTGIVSAGVYPVQESLALLARTGLTGTIAYAALFTAAALDVAIGLALLFARRRRYLYAVQAMVILAYTAVITVWLPEFWRHPYGPVLKNLPFLAAIWLLYELDDGVGQEGGEGEAGP